MRSTPVARTVEEAATNFGTGERMPTMPPSVEASLLRDLALDCGADDAGALGLDRPEVADQRQDVLRALPSTRTLLSFALRMNRTAIRTPARSVANLEFHHTGDEVNAVGRRIARALEARGIPALNPSMGFPMEMDRFPGKIWVVSHKPVAEAAGLGRMGIHRNVIHPRFGNFILLGTVLVGAELEPDAEGRPVDFNPCLTCKLCVAACPVGAIGSGGEFDFSACYTHNYREFMGGFTDWVETVADSGSARDYRRRVTDAESSSVWQSLSFGANYKAAYCMAVCPAGEEVIAPFREDRKGFVATTVRPLQAKEEPVYVLPGSDAEAHVTRRYPHKQPRRVGNSLRPRTIASFLRGLPLTFQRRRAAAVEATYHFTFTGEEEARATVVIRKGILEVRPGHEGRAGLVIHADSRAWLDLLGKRRGLVAALLTRRLRLRGSPRLLRTFAACFAA